MQNFFFNRVTFRSPENQVILDMLIKEVKGLNPTFSTQHISGKSFTSFLSFIGASQSEPHSYHSYKNCSMCVYVAVCECAYCISVKIINIDCKLLYTNHSSPDQQRTKVGRQTRALHFYINFLNDCANMYCIVGTYTSAMRY